MGGSANQPLGRKQAEVADGQGDRFLYWFNMKSVRRFSLLPLMLAGFSLLVVGCKSDDELSSRPWNAPKGSENSLPAPMTEGR